MWTLRAPFWPNRARQIVQEYFLSFSWTRVIYWFRYNFRPNAFEQVGHTWFICLSWTVATWFLRECSWANDLWQIFLHLMNCFDVNIERLFVLKCGMTLWASMTVRLFKLHGWEISFWIKCSQRGCSTFHERLFFANSSTLERKKLQCPPCLSTEVPFSAFSLLQLDFTT